ncbi:MAG TPA: hypothetical protein VLF66_19245 [Thermoanaerobaculia bacterium]|nr:hypothetical protein [Thermoanaerobaculia bacterium]
MAYSRRSFKCSRCPRAGAADGSDGCPAWWGRERGFLGAPTAAHPDGEPLEGCGHRLLPELLSSLVRSEEGHAAAAEAERNEVARERREARQVVSLALGPAFAGLLAGGPPAPRLLGEVGAAVADGRGGGRGGSDAES